MAYSISQKLNDNIQAVRLAIAQKGGGKLSDSEIAELKAYSGFGGIKAILYPYGSQEEWIASGATKDDLKLHADIIAFHDLLKENFTAQEYKAIVDSLRNSVLTAFYTPDVVPRTLYNTLKEEGILPKRLYEPSAGAGIFITEAIKVFPAIEHITAVEKDLLTGTVLSAINKNLQVSTKTHVVGLEESPTEDNEKYDLVVSNIPFGNFSVYDPDFPAKEISGKIHNYFFAKGLNKLADGGLMAYITTDAFLNRPSNKAAREYLFERADFVAAAVMPDNLMKETGNTEAPNHLIILQKNDSKSGFTADERLLLDTTELQNEFGVYHQNLYIQQHPEIVVGNEIKPGKNQYGRAHETVWQHGDLAGIEKRLKEIIERGLSERFSKALYKKAQQAQAIEAPTSRKKLTYQQMPESKEIGISVQLGLFDRTPAENIGRATAYINSLDETVVQKSTARIISTIRTTDNPTHEAVILITAKRQKSNYFLYRLHSNVKELNTLSFNWMDGRALGHEIASITRRLSEYDHSFKYEGDQTLERLFNFETTGIEPFEDLKPFYKEGTLVLHQGKVGRISRPDKEFKQAIFRELPMQSEKMFFKEYIALRDDYLNLSAREVSGEPVSDSERATLNAQYSRLISHYGILNSAENRRRVMEDAAYGLVILSSLERRDGQHFVKADILTQSIARPRERFKTDDPVEALANSLNDKGQVDLEFIGAAIGTDERETIERLGDHIYLNPTTNLWEPADQYLSGNVVEKLKQASDLVNSRPDDLQLQRSLEAIRKVQPEKIPFELLDFNLGERWIPVRYYERFAKSLFELPAEIYYFGSLDSFKVKTGHNTKVNREYAVTPKSGRTTYGYTLLEHALENTTPFFTYEISIGEGKTRRVPDNEAIQLAHQKIEQMRSGFVDWIKQLPDADKKYLEDLYNDTFNCYVLREYDGSHLTFPGLDRKALGIEDLYSSQKNATWRIIQNRGALIDHEVGLGKTLTMIVSSKEMKRLGIAHKPMILALKANVTQITETYRKAYPAAKILAPSENDFTPQKRLRLFHEIKNNTWDCIILTHDQFGKIPQSSEVQQEIIQAELINVERDLKTMRDYGGEMSKLILKGLEIRKNNLTGKLSTLLKDIEEKKDKGISFKELGVDHLFVDESHKFKNLTFTTRHNRVAGLGSPEGSAKALNMLFAVRTLQERFNADLCVTFLSGTPISNSLTEMYLLFKYLRPKEMQRQQIENFDAWAAVFTKKSVDFEFSVTNEIIAKERFRHFIKVPELALFYNQITDYKTARHINLDKPELKETLVNIKPTSDQIDFIRRLMEFAKTGNGELIGRGRLSPEEDKGRMLIATNYAKKMALDMRLINPGKYADHPDNKINVCARKFVEVYHASRAHKGTQLVFCDLGTPGTAGFNVYEALKEKLVRDFGIPANEIQFIHDWQGKKKAELFEKMNTGEICGLFGSSEMLGTGNNVQALVAAIHHMDSPWKPSEFEQRNGRGARQGNLVAKEYYDNKVQTFIYATEQSLDNYKFNLLKNKQTFISQMKNCELNVRSLDEGATDEKSGMNFSEYIAILSGDTSLLEKSKLEKKIAVMESLKAAHHREASRSRHQLEGMQREKLSTEEILLKLSADHEVYIANLQYEKDGAKANPVRMIGLNTADNEAIGRHIIDLYRQWKPGNEVESGQKIGSLYGFDLYIRHQRETYQNEGLLEYGFSNSFYASRTESGIKYTYNNGLPNTDNPKLAARYFINAIDRVEILKEKYTNRLAELTAEMPKLQRLIDKPFLKEQELGDMKIELSSLERQITLKIQENQLKQQQEGRSAAVIALDASASKEGKTPVIIQFESSKQISEDKWQQRSFAAIRRNKRFKL